MTKVKLSILTTLFVIIAFILFNCLEFGFINSCTKSFAIVWGIWFFWDRYLWQYCAGKWGIPVRISGKWRGKLTSSFSGGTEKTVNVTIKQTFSNVSLEMITNEIRSRSICSYWEYTFSSYPCLLYIYSTDALCLPNTSNLQQYGGAKLCLENKETIIINYWTSSLTKGEIKLKKISR